ncbi:MAG: signal peptidase II [Desulfovermiculus sp.]|nr:signal peptidase II [Desulfovermiculus sp.]
MNNPERTRLQSGPLILAAAIILLDQISKALVRTYLPAWSAQPVIPGFFNLVHVQNRGAAFGFLSQSQGMWQPVFFIIITIAAVAIIFSLMRTGRRQDQGFQLSLGAILGGAVGNLLDRIRLGTVTDFIDLYIGRLHWPAFNVADTAISLGAFILLIAVYRKGRHASSSD